ncbi:MAG: glycosyltransferase family 4 protein [Pseudomonadota bacterium]
MRITFVLPEVNMGGGTRVLAIYAEKLSQLGHDVLVVYPTPRRMRIAQKVKSLLRGGGWPRQARRPSSHMDGRAVEQREIDPWRPVAESDVPDADVVIATWWETAEWVARLSPRKGAKAYFLQGYETFDVMHEGRVKATWSLPMHKIVIAEWLKTLAREEYGDHTVSLVPNAVDLDQFHAPARAKQATPRVGLLYSSLALKGCDTSIEAFTRAARRLPGLQLMAFGAQTPTPSLPLPAQAEFTLRPAQDRLKDIYAACDAWLFGSRSEGFGLPLLEAMACRTPVIATPAGAAPELVRAGGGLLVRADDPEDMSRAIEKVCGMTDSEWTALSNRAHAIASSYTWHQATEGFLAALEMARERANRGELVARAAPSSP